jgi:hypothetical protein
MYQSINRILNTWVAILLIIIKRPVNKKCTVSPLIVPFVIGSYGTGDVPSEYSVQEQTIVKYAND